MYTEFTHAVNVFKGYTVIVHTLYNHAVYE